MLYVKVWCQFVLWSTTLMSSTVSGETIKSLQLLFNIRPVLGGMSAKRKDQTQNVCQEYSLKQELTISLLLVSQCYTKYCSPALMLLNEFQEDFI